MANLLSWLGNQIEGGIAQLNPWDNGADYNSVMRRKKEEEEQQAPTPRPVPTAPQPGQFNSGVSSLATVGNRPNPEKESALAYVTRTGRPSPFGAMLSANPADRVNTDILSEEEVQNAIKKRVQDQANAKRVSDLNEAAKKAGNFLANGTAKLANQGFGVIEKGAVNLAGETQKLLGDREGGQRTIQQGEQSINDRLLRPGAGLFGAGGVFESTDALHNATPLELAQKVGGTTLQSASEVLPIGRGLRVMNEAGGVGGKLINGTLEGAAIGTAGSVGSQLALNGEVDPLETLKTGAIGGVFGAVIPAVGTGVKGLAVRGESATPDELLQNPAFRQTADELSTITKKIEMAATNGAPKEVIDRAVAHAQELSDSLKTMRAQSSAVSDLSTQSVVPSRPQVEQLARTIERPQMEVPSARPLPDMPAKTLSSNLGSPVLRETGQLNLDSNNPSVNYTPDNFNSKEYVNELTNAQEMARKNSSPSLKDKASKGIGTLKAKFVDSLAPIEDTLNKAKKSGAVIEPKDDIHYQLDRTLRADTLSGQYIKDKGLDKIVQNVKDTNEFDQYLIAKHGKELEDFDITTGRDSAKDKALVAALDSKYGEQAKQITKYNHALLDKSVEYGLVSKAQAAILKKKYPNYVPFNRIFSDGEIQTVPGTGSGKASISSQSVVKKIKGSRREVESPLASIVSKTQDVITQGERNRSAAMLASYHKLPGNPFQLRELKPSETIGTKSTISYLDRGKKRTFETSPEIAAAAKSLDKEQLGLLGKILAVPTRILRLGATGINPAFTFANVTRDLVSSFINSKNGARMISTSAIKDALAAATRHNSKQYQELLREAAGGTSYDIARNKPRMNVKGIRAEKNIGTKAAYVVTHPGELLRAVEDTIGRSEEFGRALQYFSNKEGALAKNMSQSDAKRFAADAARNNSVNFARAGDYGRVLNSVLPYLNAGIQGARTLDRNLKTRPIPTISKIITVIGLPYAVTTHWNVSDEKRRKAYENISEYEKEGNIIIVPSDPKQNDDGSWNVIKIPVQPGLSNIGRLIGKAVEQGNGFGEAITAKDVIGAASSATTSIDLTDGRKIANQATPQALKPSLETMTNKNLFTGREIVPDALKNLDPENQFDKNTSGTAKIVGKTFGVSPLSLENAARTATGGLGQNLINLSDKALATAGVIKQDEVKGKSFIDSITSRFDKASGLSGGALYFKSIEASAKENKLAGKDYQQLNAMLAKEIDQDGNALPTDDKTKLRNNTILSTSPAIAKVRSDAANALAKVTGKEIDPLYELPLEKQLAYYKSQSVPKGSADQRDIREKNKWMDDFSKKRSAYFNENPIPTTSKSGTVPYPEPNAKTESLLDEYNAISDSKERVEFMKKHPEVSKAFDSFSKYTNEVRKAQGFSPLRTYQAPTKRVQKLLDSGDKAAFKDPEVAQWMQNNSIYSITKDAALAQIQGNDLSAKALKSMNNLARYNLVKNPDGTYALKYNDSQGSGKSGVKDGAIELGYSGSGKKKGRGGRKPSASDGLSTALGSRPKVAKTAKAPSLGKKSPVKAAVYKPFKIKTSSKAGSRIPKAPNIKVKRGIA